MDAPLTRLYPAPCGPVPLAGLYLGHGLRERAPTDRPYVYANFVASLDGRISLEDPVTRRRQPPPPITNPRDWRLYLELAAQSDAVLTSGRRVRDLAAQGRGTIRCVAEAATGDLGQWRRARGLPPHPHCLALSSALDFPVDALAPQPGGGLSLLVGSAADTGRTTRLRAAGIEVHRVDHARVHGADLAAYARERGIRTLYAIGGPGVLHTLLAARLLDRLYLTTSHLVLGGERFDPLLRGAPIAPPYRFRLSELYLDTNEPQGPEQLFAVYDRAAGDAPIDSP